MNITQVIKKPNEEIIPTSQWTESYDSKEGILINSDLINYLEVKDAISKKGLISMSPVNYGLGCLAMPREQEIVACFNRYRNLKM